MMTSLEIVRHRLHNQHLTGPLLEKPADVVKWLGAVQAQDYAGAKWAVAQRTKGITDSAMDRIFAEGAILRTHVLRPTWHFVAPADIHWMLELTAPRVHAVNAHMYRQVGLDGAAFKRSHTALKKALQGGVQVARAEIASILKRAGIATDDALRLGYILMQAELEGIICSGARRGKQFTYALLEERAPQAKSLSRDQALVELTRRYFVSHGPATLQDFVVWSGLTMADAKQGLEEIQSKLGHEEIDGKTYWFPQAAPAKFSSPLAHLLPNYDEYFIGFKDRSAIDVARAFKLEEDTNRYALASHIFFVDGKVAGGWRRALSKKAVLVELNPVTKLNAAEKQAVAGAAGKFGAFLELLVELIWLK